MLHVIQCGGCQRIEWSLHQRRPSLLPVMWKRRTCWLSYDHLFFLEAVSGTNQLMKLLFLHTIADLTHVDLTSNLTSLDLTSQLTTRPVCDTSVWLLVPHLTVCWTLVLPVLLLTWRVVSLRTKRREQPVVACWCWSSRPICIHTLG